MSKSTGYLMATGVFWYVPQAADPGAAQACRRGTVSTGQIGTAAAPAH